MRTCWLSLTRRLTGTRRRDMVSAVNRLCEMAGTTPASVRAEPSVLKDLLSRIRPAAHGVSAKSFSNLKSLLAAALQLAGVIDPLGRGSARRHPEWGPLFEAVADDQRLSNGLATFANWCAGQGISPSEVDDTVVQRFLVWLEARTLHPKPRDLVRGVPKLWNEANTKFNSWPTTKLTVISFKAPPKHLKWSDLSQSFQQDADAYLALRANPDLFDERPEAPKRPLSATTLRQQRDICVWLLPSCLRTANPLRRLPIWSRRSHSRQSFAITTTKPIASPTPSSLAWPRP